jgi:hypothetical protein
MNLRIKIININLIKIIKLENINLFNRNETFRKNKFN